MISELLEEYKETSDSSLKEDFKRALWSSDIIYKKFQKTYTYDVNEEILGDRTDLIELFNTYKEIKITLCKSFYNKTLRPIDYIRVHINNMYGFLTDKEVYLPRQYYQLLLSPKHEYFKAIEDIKNGHEANYKEIKNRIEIALIQSAEIKENAAKNKTNLKWNEYKELINTYIDRLFENYKPPHEYEEENGWKMKVTRDGWSEDNYVVKYFCKSLTGYLRNYVNSVRPKEKKKKTCLVCKTEIIVENLNKKYCNKCLKKITKERRKINNKNYYTKKKIKTAK